MTHSCTMHMFTDGIISTHPSRTFMGQGMSCRPAFGFESLGYTYGPNEDRYSRDCHKLLEAIPIIGIIFTIGRIIGALKSDCPTSTKARHMIRGFLASIPGIGIILLLIDLIITIFRETKGMCRDPLVMLETNTEDALAANLRAVLTQN